MKKKKKRKKEKKNKIESIAFNSNNLISKQQLKVKSCIVNINNYLNGVFPPFNSFHKELSSSFQLVDNFPD